MSDKQAENTSGYNRSLITPDENRRMFDNISQRYDLLNRIMSVGLDRKWRRRAVDQLQVVIGGEYIDAGCGTGDLCIDILRRFPAGRIKVTGIDHSEAMLAKGKAKIAAANKVARPLRRTGIFDSDRARSSRSTLRQEQENNIFTDISTDDSATLICGDATSLPFGDSTVDGVISGFVIRNICDRNKALVEWHRVIKPGGRCVILELAVPENPVMLFLYKAFTRILIPAAGALFSKYRAYVYLIDSISAFPPPKVFEGMLESAGFKDVRSEALAFGTVRIYCGTKAA